MNTTNVSLPPTLELNIDLTDEQFFQLCQNNRDLKFEQHRRHRTSYRLALVAVNRADFDRNNQIESSFSIQLIYSHLEHE
ncbi:hypothetical protein [uncultured Nostoc sp.]|uniref:hypothetical protein n=1 Tax=Nostoc sp. TaxID=1180 RepID=UPI0035CABA6D